jgi:gamma-tubulin complex component 5
MALVILLDQVMGFLLKVKRAKFVLDETRKWMWKVLFHQIILITLCYFFFAVGCNVENYEPHSDASTRFLWQGRGSTAHNFKQHLIVGQKLLHFVDAFHQYVMDRVS